ncbi:MAG: 50S ribosomal protein L22, partial [Candidatus Omnitrophota bacterium]|nr:50S ribosomal protein L22 [Candidatus Omnitrophota bacterium]
MVTKAALKYIRITPRKFRLIIPLVKGKNPEAAIAILASVKKNAARYCEDLIQSAVANARRIQGIDVSSLYISKLTADGGPMLKRFRASSMGRASQIKKRTSLITLDLDRLQSDESPEE